MADDALSGPRTNQTVVSLVYHFRPPAPKSLSRTLPVLKWGTLVFLEAEGYWGTLVFLVAEGYCKQGWFYVELFRVLLYAVQEYNFLKFAEIVLPF